MAMDFDKLMRLLGQLAAHDVDYVLIGGVALNLHGLIRATEDIDLFLDASTENVERLKAALRALWDDPSIEEILAGDLAGRYPTIRYGPPDEVFTIDLMSRLGTAVAFSDLESEVIEVDGVEVRVATPETLFRMKRDTARPIDRADAAALRNRFGLTLEEPD